MTRPIGNCSSQGAGSRPRTSRRVVVALVVVFIPLLALPSATAWAEEWSFLGARYQGMGGAGVAVVDDEHAPYWNPGALAFTQSYAAALPVGIQTAAEGSVLQDVDRVANFIDSLNGGEFDQLISDLQLGNALSASQLATAIELAAVQLPGLDDSGEGLVGNLNASLLLRYERVALSGIGIAHFGADPVFDRVNLSLSNLAGGLAVDQLVNPATAMDRYAPGLEPTIVAQLQAVFTSAASTSPNLQAEELVFQAQQAGVDVSNPAVAQAILDLATATTSATAGSFADNNSGAFVRGLAVEEIGVAYGHPLPVWEERIGIGANLKYLYGTTFNKFVRYDDVNGVGDLIDELGNADRRKTTHTVSLDVGVLVKPYDWLRFGLTARNVTRPEFDLSVDPTNPTGKNKLSVDPSVRIGAALWLLPNWIVAFDADLTENESELLDGFESRIVSLGSEFKFPIGKVELALRGGAYLNTSAQDLDSVALTGGVGLRIFAFNLDLAVGASPKTEKVEALDDQDIPTRINASATLSYRKTF